MSEKPLVSLIVPCYNIAKICDRFFASLLDQDYTNIQLILVNDGSTDNTEEKLLSYKEQLEGLGYVFDYIYQDNKGLGGAINTGLKNIKGEYFCWADADDYFEKNAFKERVEYFENHPDCMILTCDANIRNADKLDVIVSHISDGLKHHYEPKQFLYLLDYDSAFCSGSHMIRTSAFKKANPAMDIYEERRGQNWQLLLPMYYFYDRHTLPIVVYNYINYEDSMSHSDISYELKNTRFEGSERTQKETIMRINMSEGERKKYLKHIELFHDKLKMYNARAYQKKDEYLKLYKKLKAEGQLDFKDRLRKIRFVLLGR